MALLEEQEAEGAAGAGGLLPRYAVGSEVEVQIADRGFHGAYYEAIVTAQLQDSCGYEVVYSTFVEDGGGGPLREAVDPANVRPRPPPPPPSGAAQCDLNVFDMVEAYHNDGWWPGIVSGAWPAVTLGEPRYAVSFPTVPEVVELAASLVRPRRAFVRGRWMDMQQVVPRVPLYDEGSNVEVICPEGKQGMMTATIIKMVGSANYVVQHGDSKRSIVVLHSRYIRPQPVFDRMKFYYDLEPSAEVEVYRDGTWLPGVISEIGSCESSKYAVKLKRHKNAYEEDYTLVSSTFLRPCCKWDGQQWRLSSTKSFYQLRNKHARKRKHTVSVANSLSPLFSTPGGHSDQNSFVHNKRTRTDSLSGMEPISGSLPPFQVTAGSSSKDDVDIEIEAPADKHTTLMKKLDNVNEAKGMECMPASNMVLSLTCKHGVGKRRNCLTKEFANTRGNDKSSYRDVIEISDSSGYCDGIEIDNSSSCNPTRRRKRWQRPTDTGDGLHSSIVELHQESLQNSAQYTPSKQCVLLALGLEEASHVRSNNKGVQLTPLSDHPVLGMQPLQGLPALNERKELPLSDLFRSEAEPAGPYDSTARDCIQETCQEITKFLPSEQMEVPEQYKKTHDVMGMVNNISGSYLKVEDNLMNCKPCPKSEGPSSLMHPGRTSVCPAVTMDLSAIMPAPNSNKWEVFRRLPQNPHFSKLLQDCHPEFRDGKATGLMISFANLAVSIQNMKVQDEYQLSEGKMSSLAELEENGFEVGALRTRLENLVHIKNRQMDLKGKKAILEQDILEKEGASITIEQEMGILDKGIKALEQMLLGAQKDKALLVEKKAACGLEISKLQVDACRAEELYMTAESDFRLTAAAPWEACLPADNTASDLVLATTTCSI